MRMRIVAMVMRVRTTEIAAMAGSTLSRSPIQTRRGRVIASTLVTNSVTPISSHDSMKDRNAAEAMPKRMLRSEEHTSELQSLMRISYAVFCLKKKKKSLTDTATSNKTNT